jgi:hypothetical protein
MLPMSRFRIPLLVLLPLIAGTVILLSGALGQQTPPSTKTGGAATPPSTPPTAPAPPKADPEATKTLGQAIERLDPQKLPWIETTLWEKVSAQGLSFQAEGHYLAGPDRRLSLDLRIRLAGSDGQLQVVSDGVTVWNAMRVGTDHQRVTTWDMKKLQQVLNRPGTLPQIGEEFFRGQSFAGVVPLLQSLSTQMVFTKIEKGTWSKKEALKLSGTWIPEIAKSMTGANQTWQPSMPRSCVLYLDRQTYWPYRVEWIGPAGIKTPDTTLMEIEFRDPHLFKAGEKLPDAYATAFKFTPAKEAEIVDQTNVLTENLAQQVKSRPQGQSRP